MKTLIKAGAMLAIIAGLGLATASAAESACQKCSDGKCASCCKSCCKTVGRCLNLWCSRSDCSNN